MLEIVFPVCYNHVTSFRVDIISVLPNIASVHLKRLKCLCYLATAHKQIKTPLVGEHAFPLTGFVCKEAHVTFGGSGGIRSTAIPELPHPCVSHAKSRDETSRRGK